MVSACAKLAAKNIYELQRLHISFLAFSAKNLETIAFKFTWRNIDALLDVALATSSYITEEIFKIKTMKIINKYPLKKCLFCHKLITES